MYVLCNAKSYASNYITFSDVLYVLMIHDIMIHLRCGVDMLQDNHHQPIQQFISKTSAAINERSVFLQRY